MKKATKILGAVLGVLLVAALFTGAAAADTTYTPAKATDNAYNLGTIYVWQLYNDTEDFPAVDFDDESSVDGLLDGTTWTDELGINSVTFRAQDDDGYFLAGDNIVEGKYYYLAPSTKEMFVIDVKYPGVPAISGYVVKDTADNKIADLAGANIDVDKFSIVIDGITDENGAKTIAWTNPTGSLTTTEPKDVFGIEFDAAANLFKFTNVEELGEYTVQKVIDTDAAGGYASIAPKYLFGAPTTFTLYNSKDEYKLTALADEVLEGNLVTVAFEAPYKPYDADEENTGYYIEVTNGKIPAGQVDVYQDTPGTDGYSTNAWVSVGLDGYMTFVVKSANTENIKITAYNVKADVDAVSATGDTEAIPAIPKKSLATLTIKVVPGKISATATPAITNIGNEIDIIGTNELGGKLNLFMKGENYFRPVNTPALDKAISGKEFAVTLKTGAEYLEADAGYYTLYLAKLADPTQDPDNELLIKNVDDFANKNLCSAYTTIAIKLVPSFISITEMPTYAVIGEDFVVKGIAEGNPAKVQYYVFGNNYYMRSTANVEDDNSFEITITPNATKTVTIKAAGEGATAITLTIPAMEAGQYFLVIQHPMYDNKFNVYPKVLPVATATDATPYYTIMQSKTGVAAEIKELFTVDKRQTTNAAYALCRAIDGDEDVDDMYVKRSFTVVEAKSEINPFASSVTQGDALVISGTARGYKNAAVAVTISTGGAFDATSKNDAGETTGTFTEVTSVAADGSWSVSFDTAKIPVGDYKVTAKVGTASTSEEKDLKVVQGSSSQPTTTGQPTSQPTSQPTATPASPGFGILAALAGLGAVAVLLLRRQ